MIDRRKIGKASKKKGYYNESKTGKEYEKCLGGLVRPTPRSGAYLDFRGDLLFRDNILADLGVVVDCKFGEYSCPKKIKDWMEKLEDESQGKPYWLDLKIPRSKANPKGKAYCVIERRYLLQLLGELQGWRNQKVVNK